MISIRHNGQGTLTSRYNGTNFYFPPNVDTVVENKEMATAIVQDFNSTSPKFKMEIVETEEE